MLSKFHPLHHLSDRELVLLGLPRRSETLALVGYLALTNAFGDVAEDHINMGEELPSRRARRWVGGLSRVARISSGRSNGSRSYRQTVPANHKRKVRAN